MKGNYQILYCLLQNTETGFTLDLHLPVYLSQGEHLQEMFTLILLDNINYTGF